MPFLPLSELSMNINNIEQDIELIDISSQVFIFNNTSFSLLLTTDYISSQSHSLFSQFYDHSFKNDEHEYII